MTTLTPDQMAMLRELELQRERVKQPTTPPVEPPPRGRGPYRRPRLDDMADEIVKRRAGAEEAGDRRAVDAIDALVLELRRLATGAGTSAQAAQAVAVHRLLMAILATKTKGS